MARTIRAKAKRKVKKAKEVPPSIQLRNGRVVKKNLEKKPKKVVKRFCGICFEEKPKKDFTKTCKYHPADVCTDCHLATWREQIVLYGECACVACGYPIQATDLQKYSMELFNLLDKILLNMALAEMNVVYCPGKRCGAGMIGFKKNCRFLNCLECKVDFCTKCKEQHDRSVKCKQYLEGLTKKTGKGNFKWKEGNTKLCPKCHSNIEKNEGCDNMHCAFCKHNFNWQHAGVPTL